MKIKRGQMSELKAITRLYCKIWPKENQERVEDYFSGKIKNKEIFVAYEDETLVGIISFT